MTKEQLEKWRNLGFPFGDFYDTIAKENIIEAKDVNELLNQEESIIAKLGDSSLNGKADGHYFNIDGTYYASEGRSNKIVFCSSNILHRYKKNNVDKATWIYFSPIHTDFLYADVEELAANIYAEGSLKYIGDKKIKDAMLAEAYALGTTMINYKIKRMTDQKGYNPTFEKLAFDMGVYGQGDPLYKSLKDTEKIKRNGSHMQTCMAAALHALMYEFVANKGEFQSKDKLTTVPFDYSNGAHYWDGIDLKTNEDKHDKMLAGYLVADKSHNVLDVSSKIVHKCVMVYKKSDPKFSEERCWDYKYQTTAGIAKTMFVKLNEDYLYANINSEEKQGRWW